MISLTPGEARALGEVLVELSKNRCSNEFIDFELIQTTRVDGKRETSPFLIRLHFEHRELPGHAALTERVFIPTASMGEGDASPLGEAKRLHERFLRNLVLANIRRIPAGVE